MPERVVVLVENDPVLSDRLRAVMAAYHLRVELVTDGNELALRRDLEPALIILCIDPKRLGWAICNKIKKSPQYRGVPMIVTSHEATEKDFEDHKKLKTRAEEYLLKPYHVEQILEKVANLIGLDPPQVDDRDIEEIPIDDAALIEEELLTPQSPEATVYDPAGGMRADAYHQPYIDQQIADETDAAFAAIGVEVAGAHRDTDPPRRVNLPGVAPRGNPSVGPQIRSLSEAQGLPTQRPAAPSNDSGEIELGFEDVVPTGVRAAPRVSEDQARLRELEQTMADLQRQLVESVAEADRWHDERDNLASERDRLEKDRRRLLLDRDALVAERDGLQVVRDNLAQERDRLLGQRDQIESETSRLQKDRDRLRMELEEAQRAAARAPSNPPQASAASSTTQTQGTSAFSRERDYLNLREIINKKDKEILDLRDALDSKERQNLDARDKARELERTRRDLDERLLEVEKELIGARERLEALTQDKERSLERERGLKARIDDGQKKLLRAEDELDELKKRHAQELQKAEQDALQRKTDADAAMAALSSAHAQEIGRLAQERVQALAEAAEMQRIQILELTARLATERQEAEAQLGATHKAELARQLELQNEAEAQARDTHQAELARLEKEHEEARQLHQKELEAARAAHAVDKEAAASALAQTLAAHEADRQAAAATLAQTLAAHEADRQAAAATLAQVQEAQAKDREAAAIRLAEALAQAEAERTQAQEARAALSAAHKDELERLTERHTAALKEAEDAKRQAAATAENRRLSEIADLQALHSRNFAEFKAYHEDLERSQAKDYEQKLAHAEERFAADKATLLTEAQAQAEQEKNGLLSAHHREMDELTAILTGERDAVSLRLQQREAALGAARAQIAELENKKRVLEGENETFQQQILLSYQRIKTDETLISRSKKALAIALTLLDECGAPMGNPAQTNEAPSTPNASPSLNDANATGETGDMGETGDAGEGGDTLPPKAPASSDVSDAPTFSPSLSGESAEDPAEALEADPKAC